MNRFLPIFFLQKINFIDQNLIIRVQAANVDINVLRSKIILYNFENHKTHVHMYTAVQNNKMLSIFFLLIQPKLGHEPDLGIFGQIV